MKEFLLVMISILFSFSLNAQDCDCPKWNGKVIPELTVNSCDYDGDNPSLKAFAAWDCCHKKCKNNTPPEIANNSSSNTSSQLPNNKKSTENKLNQETANQEIINQKLANNLTQTFNQISSSWAKERDFQFKISTLTNIRSINASSIISEARNKAQQINTEYNEKKDDALNIGISTTQNLINSAQNEKQAVTGGLLGVGLTVLSQSSIEKERKEAQEKLENEKQKLLNNLSQKIIDEFEPLKKQHKESAIYAIAKNLENYHLTHYEYAKCMCDNAYNIIVDDYACSRPNITKPNYEKATYTGQDYYNIFKRKAQSTAPILKNNAFYFLELAIEAEPSNAIFLYERTLTYDYRPREAASILNKALELDSHNEIIKEAYANTLVKVEEELALEKASIEEWLGDTPIEDSQNWEKHNNLLIIPHVKNGEIDYFFAINNQKEIALRLSDTISISLESFADRNFNNGLLLVKLRQDNKKKLDTEYLFNYGFINNTGKVVIPFKKYKKVFPFSNGYSKIVDLKTQKIGFINTTGKQIVNYNYMNAKDFNEGFAAVQGAETNNHWGFINTKGKLVIPHNYLLVSEFSEGFAAVKTTPLLYHYIDTKGNKVITELFDYAGPFSNGLASVGNKKDFWYINKNGDKPFKDKFDMASSFNKEGYAIVRKGKEFYFINTKGENISENVFLSEPIFRKNSLHTKVKVDKKNYVLIDKTGKIIE